MRWITETFSRTDGMKDRSGALEDFRSVEHTDGGRMLRPIFKLFKLFKSKTDLELALPKVDELFTVEDAVVTFHDTNKPRVRDFASVLTPCTTV